MSGIARPLPELLEELEDLVSRIVTTCKESPQTLLFRWYVSVLSNGVIFVDNGCGSFEYSEGTWMRGKELNVEFDLCFDNSGVIDGKSPSGIGETYQF